MKTKNIADIDKNFTIPTEIERDGLVYHSAEELSVHGVMLTDGIYRRMKPEDAITVSEKVALISQNPAGGRIRFFTNSPYIAIYVKYDSAFFIPNYSFTATAGFDLYSDKRYIGAYIPPHGTNDTFEGIIDLDDDLQGLEYTINFPICSSIKEIYIGVKDGSVLKKATDYTIKKTVVFYGSSTTQGGCASRPGNIYENMVSRELDCDYLNLGFGGNALGEEAMAKYIANLEMSAFVYDYDYNAPTPEHLDKTHEKMFKIIRKSQPNLPIIMMTAPKYYLNSEDEKRVEIIERTYQNAIKNGDKNVRLIKGKDMFESVRDVAISDNIHPGDIGFNSIASFVIKALKEFL